MANFDTTTRARIDSVQAASGLLTRVHALYVHAKEMQSLLARYQAGTDAAYIAAVNAMYTAAERQELAAMLQQANALVSDWEANHAGVIGA
jgi:hypothetical protein